MTVSVRSDHAQKLSSAARFVESGALGKAEPICREVLSEDPLNVNAMCLLADIGVRIGAFVDAEKLLREVEEQISQLCPASLLAIRLSLACLWWCKSIH